jgi:hypothetical protein
MVEFPVDNIARIEVIRGPVPLSRCRCLGRHHQHVTKTADDINGTQFDSMPVRSTAGISGCCTGGATVGGGRPSRFGSTDGSRNTSKACHREAACSICNI